MIECAQEVRQDSGTKRLCVDGKTHVMKRLAKDKDTTRGSINKIFKFATEEDLDKLTAMLTNADAKSSMKDIMFKVKSTKNPKSLAKAAMFQKVIHPYIKDNTNNTTTMDYEDFRRSRF